MQHQCHRIAALGAILGPEDMHTCTKSTECAGYEPRAARYGRGWGGLTGPNKNVDGYSDIYILEFPGMPGKNIERRARYF